MSVSYTHLIRFFLLIMRGTPLILQLYGFYFGLYYIAGLSLDRMTAAIIGFSLNYAAYFAEIYRSGIQAIPKGQYEAAKVLGFNRSQTFFKIILPQVVKIITPSLGSECMTLVKDTSLAHVIGVMAVSYTHLDVYKRQCMYYHAKDYISIRHMQQQLCYF